MKIHIYRNIHPSCEPFTIYNVEKTEIKGTVLTIKFIKNSSPDWMLNWNRIFCVERSYEER